MLTQSWDTAQEAIRKWAVASSEEFVTKYIFPLQPLEHFSDCGVLVCLYIWSILVDHPIPNIKSTVTRNNRHFQEAMSSIREFIGGTIAGNGFN